MMFLLRLARRFSPFRVWDTQEMPTYWYAETKD